MHTGQNTKHTDKTAATLYDYKGGGGGRKEKANICVAEDMNCKMNIKPEDHSRLKMVPASLLKSC